MPKKTVRDFMCAVYIKLSLCWLLDLFFTNIFYFSTPKWTRVRRMSPVFCFLKKTRQSPMSVLLSFGPFI